MMGRRKISDNEKEWAKFARLDNRDKMIRREKR